MKLEHIIKIVKSSILICLIGIVAGCSSLQTTKYTNQEYQALVQIKSDLDMINCGDTPSLFNTMDKLHRELTYQSNYTKYLDNDVYQAVSILDKQVTEVLQKYGSAPSAAYCQIKIQIMDTELDKILSALARGI